jgi:hypothetical protein
MPITCEWCDKVFKAQSLLSKHIKETEQLDARSDEQKAQNTRCGRRCVRASTWIT